MTDTTGGGGGGLFDQFRKVMNETMDKGLSMLEAEQSKINKGFFEALTQPQRDSFCQNLDQQGIPAARIEKITGKSSSTVNRHINGKNS